MNTNEAWKTSYGVKVVLQQDFPEGKMIETTVALKTFQLYPHEARYLRDLLTAALDDTPETDDERADRIHEEVKGRLERLRKVAAEADRRIISPDDVCSNCGAERIVDGICDVCGEVQP